MLPLAPVTADILKVFPSGLFLERLLLHQALWFQRVLEKDIVGVDAMIVFGDRWPENTLMNYREAVF